MANPKLSPTELVEALEEILTALSAASGGGTVSIETLLNSLRKPGTAASKPIKPSNGAIWIETPATIDIPNGPGRKELEKTFAESNLKSVDGGTEVTIKPGSQTGATTG